MDIQVWTDGSCKGNPGPGGWAFRLSTAVNGQEHIKVEFGGLPHTTNNLAELEAVHQALLVIKTKGHTVTVHTDSQLVIGWLSQGWKRKDPECAAKLAEIERLAAAKNLELSFVHVKGHTGIAENEYVNSLAQSATPR